MFTCFTEPIKGQKVGKKQGFIFLGLALGTHFLFNSPFVELETELPLAIPVVTAITLYGFIRLIALLKSTMS